MPREYHYHLFVKWTGNKGQGTSDYAGYERSHIISGEGKPDLQASSDPAFRGDSGKWNPEELLLAALSSCHMLWYLHICADHKIVVVDYSDKPTAVMKIESGRGFFVAAALNPAIVITDPAKIKEAEKLHAEAHAKCFISNSVNFPITIVPAIATL